MATVVLLHRADGAGADEAVSLAQALERRLVSHLAFPLSVKAASIETPAALSHLFAAAGAVVVAAALEPLWSPHHAQLYRTALASAGAAKDAEFLVGWQDDERLLRAVVERCRSSLSGNRLDDTAVLFVADPLPESGGQDYHDAAQQLAARLVGMMAPGDWRLSFWSPSAPGVASAPPELEALLEWEWPAVLAVPIARLLGSTTDVALDKRLASVVREAGRSYRRAPALGSDPALQAALADAVVDHLARRPLPSSSAGP